MPSTPRLLRRVAATVAFLSASAVTASAQVVDFEASGGSSCYAMTCSFQGFSFYFESAGWGVSNDGNGYFNRSGLGSVGLAAAHGQRYGYTRITMTKIGGGAFNLSSFLAAVDNPGAGSPGTLQLSGDYLMGGTVNTSVSIGSMFSSYSLSGFDNLTTLRFTNTNADAGFGIDNLDTAPSSTVPEPSSVILMASGLLGVAVAARRRRKA